MCYDDQIEPDQLLRRLVYGRPAPLLQRYQRMDAPFFGRLLDALANAHAVLVKQATSEQVARNVVSKLRKELPAELYQVGIVEAPELSSWMVMVYNQVTPEMRRQQATRYVQGGPVWISIGEVARVLQLSTSQATRVVLASPIKHRRQGARNEIMIRQRDLPILANRPRRWRKRRTA